MEFVIWNLNFCMSKIIGIDYGSVRVGIAISDGDKTMAFPYSIVAPAEVIASVNKLCVQEDIEKIVVGLPTGLDNKPTAQTRTVEAFIADLKKQINVPVVTEDERMSSLLAEVLQDETKKKRRRASEADTIAVDDVAAAMILQTFLDRSAGRPR